MVFMTTASKQEAQEIVKSLLEKHLIACASIYGPVESHFWWQGRIDEANEFLVLMKSSQELFPRLSETARKIHSYDVPEILAVSIAEGFQPYLEWLNRVLAQHGEP